MSADVVLLTVAFFLAAILYSSVGHAGASGYLAAMAFVGMPTPMIRRRHHSARALVSNASRPRALDGGDSPLVESDTAPEARPTDHDRDPVRSRHRAAGGPHWDRWRHFPKPPPAIYGLGRDARDGWRGGRLHSGQFA